MYRITENTYFQKFLNCYDFGDCGGRIFLKGRESVVDMFPLFAIDSQRVLKVVNAIDPQHDKFTRVNQTGDVYITMFSFSNMRKLILEECNAIKNEKERLATLVELSNFEHFVFEGFQRVEMFKTCVKHAANLLLEEYGYKNVYFDAKLELIEC